MSDDKQPSNDALRKEIDALATELKLDISHSGKNKAELIQLREELLAKQAEATASADAPPAPTGAQRAPTEPPPPEPTTDDSDDSSDEDSDDSDDEPRPPRLLVAAGKSITSQRGILGPGSQVEPEDFAGSMDAKEARVRELLKSGALVLK